MITQYHANQLIKETLPELAARQYPGSLSLEIYASIIYFTDATKRALMKHDFVKSKLCFDLAGRLYEHGDSIVRLLIEDSFIFSVPSVMWACSKDKFLIKSILPPSLHALMNKRLVAGH